VTKGGGDAGPMVWTPWSCSPPTIKGLKPIDLVLIEYYEISARSNKQAMLGSGPRVALGVAHVTDQHDD
jgi:hypothetical protein